LFSKVLIAARLNLSVIEASFSDEADVRMLETFEHVDEGNIGERI
jgi:hypothetical protein